MQKEIINGTIKFIPRNEDEPNYDVASLMTKDRQSGLIYRVTAYRAVKGHEHGIQIFWGPKYLRHKAGLHAKSSGTKIYDSTDRLPEIWKESADRLNALLSENPKNSIPNIEPPVITKTKKASVRPMPTPSEVSGDE